MDEKRLVLSIATQSHLVYARALAISLMETNPDVELHVLLVDGKPTGSEPFHAIELCQLDDQPTIERMCFTYTAFELCNALKGYLYRYASEVLLADRWIYLDSDIMVCSSLAPVWGALDQKPIVLTAHCTRPVPPGIAFPYEVGIIRHGVYNGGFLAMKKGSEVDDFLRWFCDRLSRYAFADDALGTFVDQTWMTLIPCLFPSTMISRHSGLNLGHWNLHERLLAKDNDGSITCNGEALIFVHFSGWSIDQPEMVSRYAPETLKVPPPLWSVLGLRYRQLLTRAGIQGIGSNQYPFDCFDDGRKIFGSMRRLHAAECEAGTARAKPFAESKYFYRKCRSASYLLNRMLARLLRRLLRKAGHANFD